MNVSDIQGKAPHVLLFGGVGTGKTALALTLGKSAEVIDLDDGLRTGLSIQDSFSEARRSVTVQQFLEKEPQKRAVAFEAAKRYIYSVSNQLMMNKYPFQALVIDSLSSLADAAVRQIMSNSGQPEGIPQIQHWGLAFNEIKNVFAVIRTFKIPVIVLAHDQEGKEEGKIELAISGKKLPSQITRYFDEVLYVRAKPAGGGKMKYVVQTMNDGRVECRSRSCLPDGFDTSVGMWEMLKKMGYTPQEVKVSK